MKTRRNCFCAGLLAAIAILPALAAPAGAQDPLPSWNDGPAKKAIVDFVTRVTAEGGKDAIKPGERIAVFDNDGTLWCEQPAYPQLYFAMDRARAMAGSHPDWKKDEPFHSAIAGDLRGLAMSGEPGLVLLMTTIHVGVTTDDFGQVVRDWLRTARHPRYNRPYDSLVYQPMLEVLAFLRDRGFRTYIISGGSTEFIRAFSERVYGVPPEQVIGSSFELKFEMRDGGPVLVQQPEIDFIDDREGKPVGIQKFIGRRPVMAFGNSDGDLQMLQWTTAGAGPRFGLIVRHTDAQREWAYDRQSSIGHLDKALAEAMTKGWTVVDMKNDWKNVFPPPPPEDAPSGH